jgi:two-component sensor histidine kinase
VQELTHRIKNSLQSIAALVEARSHKSGEGKAVPERVSHCINALGQLYSKLVNPTRWRPSMRRPIWDHLCRDLVASVHKEAATSIVLKTDIDSALLPTDQGIRWGSL